MSALFNINFRREAYLKEVARARRRIVTLGVWVAYFGVVTMAMGLYGLNCLSLSSRVALIERQTTRLQSSQTAREQWQIPAAEMTRIEGYVGNPRRWHERLVRLNAVLPDNARLTSISTNPANQAGARSEDRMVLTGQMRLGRDQDRMSGVMSFVSVLREDSLFGAQYQNVRLTSTKIIEGGTGTAEFVIECQ